MWGSLPKMVLRKFARLQTPITWTAGERVTDTAHRQAGHRHGTTWRAMLKILNTALGLFLVYSNPFNLLHNNHQFCMCWRKSKQLFKKHLQNPATVYKHHGFHLLNKPYVFMLMGQAVELWQRTLNPLQKQRKQAWRMSLSAPDRSWCRGLWELNHCNCGCY